MKPSKLAPIFCICLIAPSAGAQINASSSGLACTFDPNEPDLANCLRVGRSGELRVCTQAVSKLSFGKLELAAIFSKEFGWMYVDRRGDVVVRDVAPMDNWAGDFHDGLVRTVKTGRYGFADRFGKQIVPFQYDGAFEFDRGTAIVCAGCRTNCDEHAERCSFRGGKWMRIDIHGRVVGHVNENDWK